MYGDMEQVLVSFQASCRMLQDNGSNQIVLCHFFDFKIIIEYLNQLKDVMAIY